MEIGQRYYRRDGGAVNRFFARPDGKNTRRSKGSQESV
jgi:hypothetical protein